uniref:Uncharacterized protein n=1 Tax=Arundo donax TaxID=35708 RepID=A0A0A9BYA3_ARUDO
MRNCQDAINILLTQRFTSTTHWSVRI